MRNAWKNKGTVLATGIISGILLLFFIISIVIELNGDVELPYSFEYLFLGIVVVILFIAFLIRDRGLNRYRRKNKVWVGQLPTAIIDKNWIYVMPFFVSGLFGIFLEILYYFIKWIFSF